MRGGGTYFFHSSGECWLLPVSPDSCLHSNQDLREEEKGRRGREEGWSENIMEDTPDVYLADYLQEKREGGKRRDRQELNYIPLMFHCGSRCAH